MKRPLSTMLLLLALAGCAGERPATLGLHDGHLAGCPPIPNCVSSEAAGEQQIDPFTYSGDRAAARQRLLDLLHREPRTTLVVAQSDYLHVEFASAFFGFVDDGEFFFPAEQPIIEVRSAARLGRSDFGVNRRRLERLRNAFTASP